MADPSPFEDVPVQNLEEQKTEHLAMPEIAFEPQDKPRRTLIDISAETIRQDKFVEAVGVDHGSGNVKWFQALIDKVSQWFVTLGGSDLHRYRDQDGYSYDSWL